MNIRNFQELPMPMDTAGDGSSFLVAVGVDHPPAAAAGGRLGMMGMDQADRTWNVL